MYASLGLCFDATPARRPGQGTPGSKPADESDRDDADGAGVAQGAGAGGEGGAGGEDVVDEEGAAGDVAPGLDPGRLADALGAALADLATAPRGGQGRG